MDDKEIIKLYFDRNEKAIEETKKKYENYCFSLAYRILYSKEDAEECVNDTYIAAWNSIPPHSPNKLSLFLAATVRNISVKRIRHNNAQKRGGNEMNIVLDELYEVIPSGNTPEKEIETKELALLLDSFIRSLKEEELFFFIRRYWYMYSVSQIAKEYSCTESKVKMKLKRTRDKLFELLKKEEVDL
ncbi:MAG: sigma-70 family RNA polymerase sigma factor [Clostridia bacterium]|nr:sigma-70 family RNA polymerase sigma factor [Clostridia bacterium]